MSRDKCVKSIRVLVVEDSVAFRQFVCSILGERSDLEIISQVSDGLEAVQKADELRPDLILLDIGLPGMNGYEVAKAIRADTDLGDCLLIALSGYGQDEDRLRSKSAGIDHHLIKPADLASLVDLIATHVMRGGADAEGEGRPA